MLVASTSDTNDQGCQSGLKTGGVVCPGLENVNVGTVVHGL